MERSTPIGAKAFTQKELAALGVSSTVYIRELDAEKVRMELAQNLPAGVDFSIEAGAKLFGVFAADGTRVGIADSREAAILAARQNQMTPVSVH